MSLIINFNARLGRDAEIKQTQNGSQYVAFTCATDVFTNGNTETVWFNVTDFSERSLKIVQYLTKGKLVSICGEYFDRIYTNKNNEQQIGRDVKALRIDFISTGRDTTSETATQTAQPQVVTSTQQPMPQMPQMQMSVSTNVDEDDLPF